MGSHSVTCHPAEVTFWPLPQTFKTGTRLSDHGGMQGWVDLVVFGYIPKTVTHPSINRAQCRVTLSRDEWRHHYPKLAWSCMQKICSFSEVLFLLASSVWYTVLTFYKIPTPLSQTLHVHSSGILYEYVAFFANHKLGFIHIHFQILNFHFVLPLNTLSN